MIGKINLKENNAYNYSYKGFCSIINQIVDIAYQHNYDYKNFDLHVEDEQVEYFFDVKKNVNCNIDSSKIWLDKFFSDNLCYSSNAHTEIDLEFMKKRNVVYDNIFFLKQQFIKEIEILKNSFIKEKTLGIQIRGTDKKRELPEVDIEKVYKKIDHFIEKKGTESVFLATDEEKYISLLTKKYGGAISYRQDNIFSKDGNPIHYCTGEERMNINKQVLIDVYLLANCNNLIYTRSNVGFLSLTIGINNIESADLIK